MVIIIKNDLLLFNGMKRKFHFTHLIKNTFNLLILYLNTLRKSVLPMHLI